MRWIALQAFTRTEPPRPVPEAARVQRALAAVSLAFTPRVALLEEAVLLEVSGSLRLFGGLKRLVERLKQQLEVYLASKSPLVTVFIAYGATSLIALGRLRLNVTAAAAGCAPSAAPQRVADLPLHTLSAARPHHSVLERTGSRTWDDLLGLPRDGVARRFGAPLLQALDRARGALPDTYPWLVLPEQFEEKIELDALASHTPALMAGVTPLLGQLQAWLLGRQSGISALKLTWHLDKRRDVPPTGELVIRTAQPAQDLRHVARLMAEHLGHADLPAPVHALTLQSLVTQKLADAAAATASLLLQDAQRGDSAVQLIERLSARLGDARVTAWLPGADHRPEHMQRWVRAHADACDTGAAAARPPAQLRSGSKSKKEPKTRPLLSTGAAGKNPSQAPSQALFQAPSEASLETLYPTWLLPEPLPLAARAGSPVYHGPLVRLAGPQRLEAAGWLASRAINDGNEGDSDSQGDSEGEGGSTAFASDSPGRDKPPALRDYFIYRSQQAGLLWIYSERLAVAQRLPGDATHQSAGHQSTGQRAWFLHGFFA